MPLIEMQKSWEKLGLEGKNDECVFSQIECEMMTNNLGGGIR